MTRAWALILDSVNCVCPVSSIFSDPYSLSSLSSVQFIELQEKKCNRDLQFRIYTCKYIHFKNNQAGPEKSEDQVGDPTVEVSHSLM